MEGSETGIPSYKRNVRIGDRNPGIQESTVWMTFSHSPKSTPNARNQGINGMNALWHSPGMNDIKSFPGNRAYRGIGIPESRNQRYEWHLVIPRVFPALTNHAYQGRHSARLETEPTKGGKDRGSESPPTKEDPLQKRRSGIGIPSYRKGRE